MYDRAVRSISAMCMFGDIDIRVILLWLLILFIVPYALSVLPGKEVNPDARFHRFGSLW